MPTPEPSSNIPPVVTGDPPPSEAVTALSDLHEQAVVAPPGRGARLRWGICALLFTGTAINYLDRQVLGILAPTLEAEIGWSESEYGLIVASFTAAYALGFLAFGRIIDRVGTRLGYALSIGWWSLAAMGHALARTPIGFAAARFSLGLGESGNFPAAVKATAEWFPARERAFATGVFNAGSNVGALLAPILVPWLTLTFGWEVAFLVTGVIGFVFLVVWWVFYRTPEAHPRITPAELAYIRQDPLELSSERTPWRRLLSYRQTWAFAIGKFMTDAVWWFYLFWLPKFLDQAFGVSLSGLALPLIIIYVVADLGSVGGGWLQNTLSRRGWGLNAARKTAMLTCALLVVPTAFAGFAGSQWTAVAFVALAAAAHQGWSANLFTLTSDLFPRRAVGSVVGIGGFAGALGGFLFQAGTGYYLEWSGADYAPVFVVCGLTYVVALGIIHFLVPRLEPAPLDSAA